MKVLGIHDAFDAGAALVEGGELLTAINEERLNRQKYFHEKWGRRMGLPLIEDSAFPRLSIEKILDTRGISIDDIDAFVFPHARPQEFFSRILWKYYRQDPLRGLLYSPILWPLCALYAINKRRLTAASLARLQAMGVDRRKIHFVGHHEAHAHSAYRTSGFDDSLVIVLDLEGDLVSTTVWRGRGNDLELLRENMFPFASSGAFYGNITAAAGFRKHMDECKVMGLAGYGKSRAYGEIEHGLRFDEATGDLVSSRPLGFKKLAFRLAEKVGKQDLAASGQKRLEDILVRFMKHWIDRTGCGQVCFSGGVAHNVVANGAIQRIEGLEKLHIFPHPGDGGLACGAALAHWYAHARRDDGRPSYVLRDAYLGPLYSDGDMAAALRKYGLPVHRLPDTGEHVARMLADGLVCGLFQGRMEIGPRALGNRSILANPRGAEMKDKVNAKVKFREPWRPFALTILSEAQEEYLEDSYSAPFMLLSFRVKDGKVEDVRSGTHVDGTTRPQTLFREANPRYHAILTAFRRLTGIGALLNTSMNRRGEPVCCTPEDAIECFLGSQMDALILNDYCVLRPDVPSDRLKDFRAIETDVKVQI